MKFVLSVAITLLVTAPNYAQNIFKQVGNTSDNLNVNLLNSEGNFNGNLSHSLPILTIPGRGDLQYDLYLNYNSSISVSEKSGWVGLGWSLDVGEITRGVNGRVDEQYFGMFCDDLACAEPYQLTYTDDYTNIELSGIMAGGYQEEEWDAYFLKLPEGSMEIVPEFITTDNTFASEVIFRPSPYKPYIIDFFTNGQVNLPSNNSLINSFKVTNPEGYIYHFDFINSVTIEDQNNSGSDKIYFKYPISWKLTKIQSPYSDNEITFTYDKYAHSDNGSDKPLEYSSYSGLHSLKIGDMDYGVGVQNFETLPGGTQIRAGFQSHIMYDYAYIEEIETATHIAKFITELRSDNFAETYRDTSGEEKQKRLIEIQLIDKKTNSIVKKILFDYSGPQMSVESYGQQLTLSGITISGNDTGNPSELDYKFQYDPVGTGFNDGGLGVSAGKHEMVRMDLPTGGHIEYFYENDNYQWHFASWGNNNFNTGDFVFNNSALTGGGTRLSSRVEHDGRGNTYTYNYTYGEGVLHYTSDDSRIQDLFTYSSLNSAGVNVGYRSVTVEFPNNQGFLKNYYTSAIDDNYKLEDGVNDTSTPVVAQESFPDEVNGGIWVSHGAKHGQIWKTEKFKDSGGSLGALVEKTTSNFDFIEEFRYSPPVVNNITPSTYPTISWKKTNADTTFYEEIKSIKSYSNYDLNSFDFPENNKPKTTIFTNSNNEQRTMETVFGYEQYSNMKGYTGTNQVNQVYSSSIKDNTTTLSKTWTKWQEVSLANFRKGFRKQSEWAWDSGNASNPPTTSNANELGTYSYDAIGNISEILSADGVKTSYDWSDDGAMQIGEFLNADADEVFAHSFALDGLSDWTEVDVNNDGDTEFSIENGKLKLKNFASATSGEVDRIYYDHGTEISGDVVIEFDVKIANSNSWDLTIAIGGNSWGTGNGGSENAAWTSINNESWRVYNGVWTTIKSGLTVGKTYSFKIVLDTFLNRSDYYVNGEKLIFNNTFRQGSSGIQKIAFGNYGYGSTTTEWYIDNVRMYPKKALASTQEVDPIFRTPLAIKDAAGATQRFEYDDMGRPTKAYSPNGELVENNIYYYSLDSNSSFSSSDPNRVENWAYYNPNNSSDVIKSIQYTDGLGRETQTQLRGGTRTLITGTKYNDRGLLEAVSRPIEKSSQTVFLTNLFDGTGSFDPVSGLGSNSEVEAYYDNLGLGIDTDYAFSYTQYEPSPLARVEKSTLPGDSHKLGSGKEMVTTYGVNTTETFATSAQGSVPAKTWAVNTLNKTIAEDPDEKKSITYTNSWGQIIANGVDMNGDNKLVRSNDLVTELAYDKRGNLVRVEDPRGLATTYAYNALGQLESKQLPDQFIGATKYPHSYRYDKKGRLRFHRDPNLDAGSDHYYYTKYDELDRPVEAGIRTSSAGFDSETDVNNQNFPSSSNTVYVTYSYDGDNPYSGHIPNNTKGRLTKTSSKDPNSSYWASTWYSYNELGLVEWVIQAPAIPTSNYNRKIEYSYDELGRMTRMVFNSLSSSLEDHYFWYYYDELGRLEKVTSFNSNLENSALTEAEYTFYADGQVKQLKLGDGAQTVDYDYTIQGWLDDVNNGVASGSDQFGMALSYRYNGNISQQQWAQQSASNSNLLTYTYTNDNANRLTNAQFSGTGYSSTAFDVNYAYDKSGNLDGITRKNNSGNSSDSPFIMNVPSTSNRLTDFEDANNSYTLGYDANGNMTSNTYQDITTATYDWRNLPTSVTANGSTLYYMYDADGNRIKKQIGSITTWYVRGADGQTLAAYDGSGNLLFINILANSQIIGQIEN